MKDQFSQRLLEVLEEAASVSGDREEGAGLRIADRLGIGRFVRLRMGERTDAGAPDGERILLGLEQGILREAAEELSAKLTARGVQHFFVKGMALSDRLYGTGEREMSDIDVHVAPSSRDAVRKTLDDLGYYIPPDEEQSGPEALRSGFFAGRYSGATPLEHIGLDVAWGLDPVDKLLPRPDRPVPEEIWRMLDTRGALPVPSEPHHVVLLVHHLLHHDMLHFRGLVDLALLWPTVGLGSWAEIEQAARKLGVWRATLLLAATLRSEFGVKLEPPAPAPQDWRGRRAIKMLNPVNWCVWAVNAADSEFVEINTSRIRRRLLLIDTLLDVPGLLADAVLPPKEYLAWRWPDATSMLGARWRHLIRVAGKLT